MINQEIIPIYYAYIDPGTGSMLFTILVGMLGVLGYGIKSLFLKFRFFSRERRNTKHSKFLIYTDSKRYWNVFKSICEEFEKNKVEIKYLTQSNDDPVFEQKYNYVNAEYIGNDDKSFSKLNSINADIVLSTTPSLDVYQWKRSKNVKYYIHIPHACSDITIYRLFGIDYYDAILLSGQFQIEQVRKLEKLRNLPSKELEIVGLTYFDDLKERLEKEGKIYNKKPVVLLAPSWGPSSLLNLYGEELIDRLLETGYHIIIRPHPQSFSSEKELIEKLINKYKEIEWNRDNDNFYVLKRSDIMISDFSGVIFDFALVFNKPVIYANNEFDDSIYDAHWLNEELWSLKVLPEIGHELKKEDFADLKTIIDDTLNNADFAKGRKRAIKESWEEKGKSAKNIYNYMVAKQEELGGER